VSDGIDDGRPARLAAIDMGSNAIRLRIVEPGPAGRRLLAEQRLPVRLGLATYGRGFLDGTSIAGAVEALRSFREACQRSGVRRYRAVATAALRDAPNRVELVDRVRQDPGLHVEVITGEEEARLLYLGVADAEHDGTPVALIELGSGSLQVAAGNGSEPSYLACLPMGALRLAIQHGAREAMTDDALAELERSIRQGLAATRQALLAMGVRRVLAAGGGFRALTLLALTAGGLPDRLTLSQARTLAERVARLTARQKEGMGLPADRADTMTPAACLAVHLIEMLGLDAMQIVDANLRDGILSDLHVNGHHGSDLA
jgi:exopolyphosphatase/guanosine-5'-triphosphate,3'-diphosphate pyrophosphatase